MINTLLENQHVMFVFAFIQLDTVKEENSDVTKITK